jgi:hypothetical protein
LVLVTSARARPSCSPPLEFVVSSVPSEFLARTVSTTLSTTFAPTPIDRPNGSL